MGLGRQKAKQTKVARELKYYSPETDYARLQRELRGERVDTPMDEGPDDDDDYDDWRVRR
jgi:hypothetical protein